MDDIKRYYGIYRGVVKSISDPQKQRRIQVVVPQVTGSEVTNWAWPVESSGNHVALPTVGQGVWVSYEGGDPEYPIWLGTFGKNQGKNYPLDTTPLPSQSTIPSRLITNKLTDGTTDINVAKTLLGLVENDLYFGGSAPSSSTSTGTPGQVVGSSSYLYVCYAANKWIRLSGSTDMSWH